jgi:hypothetical protein
LDAVRDLAQFDPWQESLERSRARRNDAGRARGRRRRRTRRLLAPLAAAFALALLAVTLPGLFGGHAGQPSLAAVEAAPLRPDPSPHDVASAIAPPPLGGAAHHDSRTCPLVDQATGYVNPLGDAKVMSERIDQGVDYAGTGRLLAIGAGRITHLATSETGWPGAFIEYRLSSGPDQGCYVYYAEGVIAARHLHVGQSVSAGQAIASIIPDYSSGIEIGWGAGVSTKTYAAELGQWDYERDADSVPTRTGRSFSALIAALGGPPGKAEGG